MKTVNVYTKERLGKVSQLYIPNSASCLRIAFGLKIVDFQKGKAEECLICSGFGAFWANISFLWIIAVCSSYHLEQVDQSRPLEQYTYPNDHFQNEAIQALKIALLALDIINLSFSKYSRLRGLSVNEYYFRNCFHSLRFSNWSRYKENRIRPSLWHCSVRVGH